jgi:hypothetical protein
MKYNYPDFKSTPGETMQWKQGQPCSYCGKPTDIIFHKFASGNNAWEYFAPLYHNVAEKIGFCNPICVMGWIDSQDPEKKEKIDEPVTR